LRFYKLLCPKCGRYLLNVSENAAGVIQPYCKGCKSPVNIRLGGVDNAAKCGAKRTDTHQA